MLPKKNRISRKDFPNILKIGRRYNSPHLLLYVTKNRNNLESKFSFSASKKNIKKAVDRNKYRRRGYFAVSEIIEKSKSGFCCIFFFKKGHYPAPFKLLGNEINSLLKEAGVLI